MIVWQDILSAPKDGTRILGFDGLGIAIIAFWQPSQEQMEDGCTAGWCSHSNQEDEFIDAPTHWMPLPEPPK